MIGLEWMEVGAAGLGVNWRANVEASATLVEGHLG